MRKQIFHCKNDPCFESQLMEEGVWRNNGQFGADHNRREFRFYFVLNNAAYCWNGGGCSQSWWLEKLGRGRYRSVKSFDTSLEWKERSHGSRSISSRRLSSVRKESCRKNVLLTSFRLHYTLYILIAEDRVPDTGRALSAFFVILAMETGIHGLWNPMYTRWDRGIFACFQNLKGKRKKKYSIFSCRV